MSARRSPPTLRVMRVLETFAAEPSAAMSLSTVARRLDLSPATCLGILNELTVGGYLERDPQTLAYQLGPTLAALGRAATEARPALDVVSAELAALAECTGMVCNAATAVEDQIVIVDVASPNPKIPPPVRVGARFPFRAPVGLVFAVWDDDEAVEQWLARSPLELPAESVDHAWNAVATCRRAGYLARRLGQFEMEIYEMLSHTLAGADRDELAPMLSHALGVFTRGEYIDIRYERGRTCPVANISAPAFNDRQRPEYVLTVQPMDPRMRRRRLDTTIAALQAACGRISAVLGGSSPTEHPELVEGLWARTGDPKAG